MKRTHLIIVSVSLLVFSLSWGFSWRFFLTTQNVLGLTSDLSPSQIISLTNLLRTQRNLPTLTPNLLLEQAALAKAQDMVDRGYFSHQDPEGREAWHQIDTTGYVFLTAGENLARNFSSARDLIQAWENSPGHRDNLLNPDYSEIGVAVIEAGSQTYIVQLMATPISPTLLAQLERQKNFQPTQGLNGFRVFDVLSFPPSIAGFFVAILATSAISALSYYFAILRRRDTKILKQAL